MAKAIIAERDEAAAGNADRTPSARWALASLSLSMSLSSLGAGVALVATPTLAQAFDAPFRDVQWVVLAYLLAVTSLIVGAGRLGDVMGRRRLLLVGIASFTVASVLCGLAPTLPLLVAARAAQGSGAALMMALAMASVGEAVRKEKVGSAMGLLGAMSAIGTALGPALGGVLIAGFGWRTIFLVTASLGALTLLVAHRHLPADHGSSKADRGGFDVAGSLLLASALATYALAVTIGRGGPGSLDMALLAATFLLLGIFMFVETRAASPLVPPAMFRDSALSAGLAMSGLVSTVMMTTLVVGPFHLSRALGLEPALVGLVMSVGPLVVALAAAPAGRVVDRFGVRRTTVAGLVGMAAGSLVVSLTPTTLGVPGYVGPLVILTAGYALFQTANNAAVMSNAPADRRGVVSGMLNLSRNLGLISGASAMGAVFTFASGATDVAATDPEAVAFGARVTFAVATFLIVLALGVAVGGLALSARPAPTRPTP